MPEQQQSETFIFGYSSQSKDLRNAILKTTEKKQIFLERTTSKLVFKQEQKKDKYRGPKLVRKNEDQWAAERQPAPVYIKKR